MLKAGFAKVKKVSVKDSLGITSGSGRRRELFKEGLLNSIDYKVILRRPSGPEN